MGRFQKVRKNVLHSRTSTHLLESTLRDSFSAFKQFTSQERPPGGSELSFPYRLSVWVLITPSWQGPRPPCRSRRFYLLVPSLF